MPLQFKNIAVGNLQDDVSGNNYAANKAVYILNLNNTLAQIFSDEAGLIPIVQDGVNNVTGAKGVFGFWVEAGDYFVQVGANKYRFSITGADYFNNRIDETIDIIVDSVAGRGAYYPVGSFEAGFTYTDINQVGTFGVTDYYIFTGGLTNLPHNVTAGTDPTLSSDYAQVFYGEIDNIQGLRDELNDRALYLTLAEAQAKTDLVVGQHVRLTDRGNPLCTVKPSDGSEDGILKLSLPSSLMLEIDTTPDVLPAKWFGIDTTGAATADSILPTVCSLGKYIYNDGIISIGGTVNVSQLCMKQGVIKATTPASAINCGLLKLRNVTIDGNGNCESLINKNSFGDVSIRAGEVKNFNSPTYAHGITISGSTELMVIKRVKFNNIKALANGTQGDTNGAVRAIYISGTVVKGEVKLCYFVDINNVDVNGDVTWEDADAIQIFAPNANVSQNITIRSCVYENIGKRFVKAQGNAKQVFKAIDCKGSSAWTGTPDDSATLGNGMFAVYEIFDGRASIEDCEHLGGVTSCFVTYSRAVAVDVTVSGNRYKPEYHEYVNQTRTRHIIGGGAAQGTTVCTITKNYMYNSYIAFESLGGKCNISDNPEIEVYHVALSTNCAVNDIKNNYFKRTSASTSTTSTGAFFDDNTMEFASMGNTYNNFRDGVNISGVGTTRLGKVVGDTFIDITRDEIRDTSTDQTTTLKVNNISNTGGIL